MKPKPPIFDIATAINTAGGCFLAVFWLYFVPHWIAALGTSTVTDVHAKRSRAEAALWARDLASANHETRAEAADRLVSLGGVAAPVVARFLRLHDPPAHKWIEKTRRYLGFRFTTSEDRAKTRELAASVLGRIRPSDPWMIEEIFRALGDPSSGVASEAESALRRIGQPAVAVLERGLLGSKPVLRKAAASVLGDLGTLASHASPALLRATADPKPEVRCQAILALAGVSLSRHKAGLRAAHLLENDPDVTVRVAAAEACGGLTEAAAITRPVLEHALTDVSARVRVASSRSLVRLNHVPPQVALVLARALSDRDAGWLAAFTLGELGSAAHGAIPDLIKALIRERGPRPLREPPSAAVALGRIGTPAIEPLLQLLHHGQAPVRTSAAIALGRIGPAAKPAVPSMVDQLRDPIAEVRHAVALSLGGIDLAADGLRPVLVEMTHEDDLYVSSAASILLQKLNPTLTSNAGPE